MKQTVKVRLWFLLAVVPAVVLLDQWTKWLVIGHFQPYKSVNFIGQYFRFTFLFNQGGIWGTDPYALVAKFMPRTLFFCVMNLLASSVVLYLYFKSSPAEKWLRGGLASILGGAAGNLIDRLRFGRVVDFVDWGINENWRWAIFNVADSAVTVGITIIIIATLFAKKPAPETPPPPPPEIKPPEPAA